MREYYTIRWITIKLGFVLQISPKHCKNKPTNVAHSCFFTFENTVSLFTSSAIVSNSLRLINAMIGPQFNFEY